VHSRKSHVARLPVAAAIAVSFAGACHDPSSIAVVQFWILLFIGAALSAARAEPIE
jgi:hypothetical protein